MARDRAGLAGEEARLAGRAAAGDGGAFAMLYERYEQRAFNLAYRIAGSEADAADAVQVAFLDALRHSPPSAGRDEPTFGSCLLAATRNACYDLMHERDHPRPSAAIGEDTEREAPLESRQAEVREASMRLPERQREVLALRELEELPYEEIGAIMEMSRSTVAQLISRARINLRDEICGTALASVAAPSPECERALPLIAMREDGQLEGGSRDGAWLDTHLVGCDRCRLAVEAMQGASSSYRAWAPIGAVPWLFSETMAKAAALVGADWSEAIAATAAAHGTAEPPPGTDPPRRIRRRRAVLVATIAALLLLAGLGTVLARDDPPTTPAKPVAGSAAKASRQGAPQPRAKRGGGGEADRGAAKRKAGKRPAATDTTASEAATVASPGPAPVPAGGGAPAETAPRPSPPPAKKAVQPTQRAPSPTPKPKPKPKPAPPPAPAPQPAPTPVPPAEESPPVAEAPDEQPGKSDPPGKPADRPPHK